MISSKLSTGFAEIFQAFLKLCFPFSSSQKQRWIVFCHLYHVWLISWQHLGRYKKHRNTLVKITKNRVLRTLMEGVKLELVRKSRASVKASSRPSMRRLLNTTNNVHHSGILHCPTLSTFIPISSYLTILIQDYDGWRCIRSSLSKQAAPEILYVIKSSKQ